jgi:hypothetical protein
MGRKKIEIGDIFELPTNKGYVYLQCVQIPKDRRQELELIRVYYQVHPDNTTDVSVIQESQFFYLSFVLQAAYNRKIVNKIGNIPLEPEFKIPRYFRTENAFGEGWQIIDTSNWQRETKKKLTEEQKKLSPWGTWNDTLLIDRLDKGWTLENWKIKK